MTKRQLRLLADSLLSGGGNVYRAADWIAGKPVGDEVFDALWREHGVYKCVECDRWIQVVDDPQIHSAPEFCVECRG